MVFLGTPNRGSDYVPWLRGLLALRSADGAPPYVENLESDSVRLTEISVLFQRYCHDLMVYSFYESRPMTVGRSAVVESSSAIVGVRGERAAPLNGDHRQMCKFTSPEDSNYRTLTETFGAINRDLLGRSKLWLHRRGPILTDGFLAMRRNNEQERKDMRLIQEYLVMPEIPEDDLRDTEDIKIENSCDWFTSKPEFQEWLSGKVDTCSRIFWLYAKPGMGKSTLAGHIVTILDELNGDCSYYFFRHGDKTQATVSGCLQSLMWQMARRNIVVRNSLLSMLENGVHFEQNNPKTIWRRIFEPILMNPELIHRQFWVIDGLDECSDPRSLFFVFSKLAKQLPVSLFVTSRRSDEIVSGFRGLNHVSSLEPILSAEIQVQDTRDAITKYLKENQHKVHVSDRSRVELLLQRILCDSQGCFLWVRLLLDELNEVWTTNQVDEAIEEGIPQGMDLLYARCIQRIESKAKSTINLARSILTWVVCAVRPLTVAELVGALETELGETLEDPYEAIPSICAQMVHVDASDRVLIVHLTAKSFLQSAWNHSSLAISPAAGHQKLSKICLQFLVSDVLQPIAVRPRNPSPEQKAPHWPDFLSYAATNMKDHLERSSNALRLWPLIYGFFQGNVFTWIEFVASKRRLEVLNSTVLAIKGSVLSHEPRLPNEQIEFLRAWIVDVHRLVSLFGPDLIRQPISIHFSIPPLCPASSAIRAVYGKQSKGIVALGVTDDGWGDEVACINSENTKTQARAVACAGSCFAVSFGSTVNLYEATTCQESKRFEHNHDVRHVVFNDTGTILCSAGKLAVNVWNLEDDTPRHTILVHTFILSLSLCSGTDSAVLVVLRDHSIIKIFLGTGEVSTLSSQNPICSEPACYIPPVTVVSPDETKVAVSCLERHLKIFDMQNFYKFQGLLEVDNGGPATFHTRSVSYATCAVFNRDLSVPILAAGYLDGTLALFNHVSMRLVKSTKPEYFTENASPWVQRLKCSPDGTLLLVAASKDADTSIILFGFRTLQALFKIPAYGGPIRELTFNADGSRILEVRQRRCTIWEHKVPFPVVGDPSPSHKLRTATQNQVQIRAVTVDPSGDFFFFGKVDGTVWYNDIYEGHSPQLLVTHEGSVLHLRWATKRKLLIVATDNCPQPKLFVHPVQRLSSHTVGVSQPIFRMTFVFPPWSLLLNGPENLLLYKGPTLAAISDLNSRKTVFSFSSPGGDSWKWTTNPADETERVLWLAKEATIWSWLSDPSEIPLAKLPIALPGDPLLVSVTSVFENRKVLLAVTASLEQSSNSALASLDYYLFDVAPLVTKTGTLTPARSFGTVGSRIGGIVGSYGSRLVFLDDRLRICSVELLNRAGKEGFRHATHFFIPSYWCEDLTWFPLAKLTARGDILVCKGPDVVVIKNGLLFEDEVWEVFDD